MPPTYPGADCEKTQAPINERDYKLAQEYAQCPGRPMSSGEIVAKMFTYQAPTETTIPKHAAINQAAKNLAEVILQNCPPGSDRAQAINCVRMVRMVANSAIALNGLSLY